MNVERYGNTAAGSVPIALCEAIEQGRVKPGDQVVLVGVGGGLAWAAAAMEWTAATPGEPTAVRVAESSWRPSGAAGAAPPVQTNWMLSAAYLPLRGSRRSS